MVGFWDTARASPLAGVDAAISAWAADQRSKAMGRVLSVAEAQLHGALSKAAEDVGRVRGRESRFPKP